MMQGTLLLYLIYFFTYCVAHQVLFFLNSIFGRYFCIYYCLFQKNRYKSIEMKRSFPLVMGHYITFFLLIGSITTNQRNDSPMPIRYFYAFHTRADKTMTIYLFQLQQDFLYFPGMCKR